MRPLLSEVTCGCMANRPDYGVACYPMARCDTANVVDFSDS